MFSVSREQAEAPTYDWGKFFTQATREKTTVNTYYIGQVLKIDQDVFSGDDRELLFNLPNGAVTYSPTGRVKTRGKDEPDVLHTGNYIIVGLPEKTDRERMADELWEVRQKTAVALGVPSSALVKNSDHEAVYLALADYVIGSKDEQSSPTVFIDGDGDPWYRCPNGKYSMDKHNEYATRGIPDIIREFGDATDG